MVAEVEVAAPTCWLARADETRIRVGTHGVALGRALGNDVVVRHPGASQLHAIVHVGAAGPELLVFGRNGTRVNGVAVEGPTGLTDGDRIDVPGESLTVEVEGMDRRSETVLWALARPDGSLYGLRREFRVGSGPHDDLDVPGWPAGAMLCSPVQGALVLEFGCEARVGDRTVSAGEICLAQVGDEVEIGGALVRLFGEVPVCERPSPTLAADRGLPLAVDFAFLPSGGELKLTFEGGEASIRLSEVRARLVATLLGAGTSTQAGDWMADEVVIPQVWPRQEGKTRVDVNILVHRLRRDLLKLGLNPFAVVEREERATRFLIASGGSVRIE